MLTTWLAPGEWELLARRLGEEVPGGVRIPLALKQKRIEEILSAGHTQATMAFRTLFAAGVLVHDAGGWRFDAAAWQARWDTTPFRDLTDDVGGYVEAGDRRGLVSGADDHRLS
jgi:hypothetical protein